jgi:RecB family exonuclease
MVETAGRTPVPSPGPSPGPRPGSGAGGLAGLVTVGYGRAAIDALAAAVAAAKADDPLGPVTVVVPSHSAGIVARRALGAAGRGCVNVSFLTPFELAERLGAAALAARGLEPLTNVALAGAIRAELHEAPGPFTAIAAHPATEAALAGAYAELSRARPATRRRLAEAGGRWPAALVALFERVRARLHTFGDEDDLARAALEASAAGAPGLGSVVVHLPQPASPALTDLLREIGRHVPVQAIVGLTGRSDADAAVRAALPRLGWHLPVQDPPSPGGGLSGVTGIVEAADPDEEVRTAVRRVVALAADGVALDRVAVLYPTAEPYARILHEQLAEAGIAFHGPAVRVLGGSVAGRTLLRLLDLAEAGLRRDAVISLVTSAPVRTADGHPAPVHQWDAISREAGVLGHGDWASKLEAAARRVDDRIEGLDAEAGSEHALAAAARERAAIDSLAALVRELGAAVAPESLPTTWEAWAEWARGGLALLVGDEGRWSGWPAAEVDAATRVDAVLRRIGTLDGIAPPPGLADVRRALELELAEPTARIGRFGEGLLIGPIALGVGLDLHSVFVLGLVEGRCPVLRQEDSLLSDAARDLAVEGELGSRADRVERQLRELLAALAAGSTGRVLLCSRGDPRSGRRLVPSRWLLAAARARAGAPVGTRDLIEGTVSVVERVPSFTAGIAAGPPATTTEWDLAALLGAGPEPARLAAHPLVRADGRLEAGLAAQRARASAEFTRWDGNLAGAAIPSPARGVPLSPTRLEHWAACPFRYFLGRVLGLDEIERPEEILEISARDRGSLVHEVLEQFLGEEIARPRAERIRPGEQWSDDARARLHELADAVCDRYERRGLTGRDLLWRIRKEQVHVDLDGFLAMDEAWRADLGMVPEAVEMAFGVEGAEPLQVELPGGRSLAFRGVADRVDLDAHGAPIVVDYKTGSARGFEKLSRDPVARGRKLQLSLYAEAASRRFGVPAAAAYYWFPTRRGGNDARGYAFDPASRARFLAVLEEIVEGIESGVFPAEPEAEAYPSGFENCRYCEFDRLCPSDRLVQQDAKAAAPQLVRFRTLRDTEVDLREGP